MAINPETLYTGKINPSNDDYPYGSARNVTTPGDGTGTPWEASLVKDWQGFFQALLVAANVTPNGNPDSVTNPQYMTSLFKGVGRVVASFSEARALKSADLLDGQKVFVTDPLRGGEFVKSTSGSAVTDNDALTLVFDDDPNAYLSRSYVGKVYPTWWGAVGDGSTDDTAALQAFITWWRSNTSTPVDWAGLHYRCSQPFNLTSLGTISGAWEGKGCVVEFFNCGNKPALVDLSNSKEPIWNDFYILYPAGLDDADNTLPFVGVLHARISTQDFTGRQRFKNVKISGGFQKAAYYNYGAEENTLVRLTCANSKRDRRAAVWTASNTLTATSEFITLMSGPITTTQHTLFQPSFTTAGDAGREAVILQGIGGFVALNPYSSSGFTAHYSLQGIDQAISGVDLIDYQAEVDRTPGIGTNASYVARIEGDGSKDAAGITIKEQLATLTTDVAIRIENVRFLKRCSFKVSRKVRAETGVTVARSCDFEADGGAELSALSAIYGGRIYAEDIATIQLPTQGSTLVQAANYPVTAYSGQVKQNAVTAANELAINAQVVQVSNASAYDINTLLGGADVSGLNVQEYWIKKANPSHTVVFKHNIGNIYTQDGLDRSLGSVELMRAVYHPVDGFWRIY